MASNDREKLLRMAQEAGIVDNDCGWPESTEYGMVTWNELSRFAELVRADEREECAMECIKVLELSNNIAASVCLHTRIFT